MIGQWMVAAILVTALLALAAQSVAVFQRRLELPRRWLWLVVMIISSVAPVAMALRMAPSPLPEPHTAPPRALRTDDVQPLCCIAPPTMTKTSELNSPLLIGWGIITFSLVLILGATHRRTTKLIMTWRPITLHGESVVVAPDFGPAAVGLLHASVVLPEWVLELPPEEQQLVLRHEVEHIRAGDQFVLFGGLLLAVLMPWNLALWWQLRRLRIGIELDCDSRVAPTTRDRPRYADLLVRARLQPSTQHATLGFVATRSSLSERLHALLDRNQPSRAELTGWSFAAMGCATLLFRVSVPSVRPFFEKQIIPVAVTLESPATTVVPQQSPSRRVAMRVPIRKQRTQQVTVAAPADSAAPQTVRYDILLPIDPAMLVAPVGRGSCVACGVTRKSPMISDSTLRPISEMTTAIPEGGRAGFGRGGSGRGVAARRTIPDSFPLNRR